LNKSSSSLTFQLQTPKNFEIPSTFYGLLRKPEHKNMVNSELFFIVDMPISDELEEVAAPILYELVEKRGNNFQPWTGKRNYEPWRGKRLFGHTMQGN
jgi:hypothetical protein